MLQVKLIAGAIVGLFVLIIGSCSFYTVDQGEVGVVLRTGAISHIAEPGLGFKIPFIDRVKRLSVQQQVAEYPKLSAYSKDQQPAVLRISVNYRVLPEYAAKVYETYGSIQQMQDRLLSPKVYEEVKTIFGKFNAVTAIQDRARLNAEVGEAVRKSVKGPLILDTVQIENIDFSNSYERSIEERMLAEVEVQKLKQNAEREKVQAEIVVTKAQAEADALRARALAKSEAVVLAGKAEAEAIEVKAKALSLNAGLVELIQAEKWNGQLPTTMVPGSTVPFINVK